MTTLGRTVTCPQCGSDQLQEVGCVDYFSRGQLVAFEDGTEWIPSGTVEHGDVYSPTHVVCVDCWQEVRKVGRDAHNPVRDIERLHDVLQLIESVYGSYALSGEDHIGLRAEAHHARRLVRALIASATPTVHA